MIRHNGLEHAQLSSNQLEIINSLIQQGIIYQPETDQVEIQPVYQNSDLNYELSAEQFNAMQTVNFNFARSDRYAEFVRTRGQRLANQIDDAYVNSLMQQVRRSIDLSADYISDENTAFCIEDTIHEALTESPTFRQVVAFSLGAEREDLNFDFRVLLPEIRYVTNYEPSPSFNIAEWSERDMSGMVLTRSTSPMLAEIEFFYDAVNTQIPHSPRRPHNQHNPHLSIAIAPPIDSYMYPIWQLALIHEMMHALTNADDPLPNEQRLGPAEILAQYIITEINAFIRHPQSRFVFNSYNDANRVAAITELMWMTLANHLFLSRNPRRILERLLRINRLTRIELGSLPSENHMLEPHDELLSLCLSDRENNSQSTFIQGVDAATIEQSFFCTKKHNVIFNDGLKLSDLHLKKYDLFSVALAKDIAEKNGVIDKKEYRSWKDFYGKMSWKSTFGGDGIFDYGIGESNVLLFSDGSFAIGISGFMVFSYQNEFKFKDKWFEKINSAMAGQVYFDINGRPVSIVMTTAGTGIWGSGWSFVYNNRGWEYESTDDWNERRFSGKTESLDPYAPRFLINNVEKNKKEEKTAIIHDEL